MNIIFVTGGVVSSLGKGIVASVIGGLLHLRGYKVKVRKIDPYLNVDSGTLSPSEHGEVFVTCDGAETDLDLGHYERLAFVKTSKTDYMSAGEVYWDILSKERKGVYIGKTIQVIPHVTNRFQEKILQDVGDVDFLICEIGGTVGDIESIPILEAARQLKYHDEPYNVLFLHVALMPYLSKVQEWKTKPIQHSVRALLSCGIQADLLLCRMESFNNENWKEKIAPLSNIKKNKIFCALDADSVYHAMLNYEKEGIAKGVLDALGVATKVEPNIKFIEDYVNKLDSDLPVVKIALVGKYVDAKDAYISLKEALQHGAMSNNKKVQIKLIDSEKFKESDCEDCDGVLVAGGFGVRGVDGKIAAIRYAKKVDKPFLGICFGLQIAVIEAMQEIFPGASSSEFGECEHPVIAKMSEWMKEESLCAPCDDLGGTMRLGSYPCELQKGSVAHNIYNADLINERHRHRYEVNNNYVKYFDQLGLTVSGRCGELVEIIERSYLKFFVAVQFHPEFRSNIINPNPLFVAFIKACSE